MISSSRPQAYLTRSKLFVPGSRPELFEKALASAADALSFDLEDAVLPAQKDDARRAVAAFVQNRMPTSMKTTIVRVNAVQSPLFVADIEALVGPGLHVLNIPKLQSAEDVRAAVSRIEDLESKRELREPIKILANIETPAALRLSAEIATSSPRIVGLQIGLLDLCHACGIDPTEEVAVQHFRITVRVAAAEAGVAAYDSAFANIKDVEGFRASAITAKRIGFSGKSCIHPSQVPVANEVFSPSTEDVRSAERIITAAAASNAAGAFALEGQMIDAPVIARARAILELAATLNREPA